MKIPYIGFSQCFPCDKTINMLPHFFNKRPRKLSASSSFEVWITFFGKGYAIAETNSLYQKLSSVYTDIEKEKKEQIVSGFLHWERTRLIVQYRNKLANALEGLPSSNEIDKRIEESKGCLGSLLLNEAKACFAHLKKAEELLEKTESMIKTTANESFVSQDSKDNEHEERETFSSPVKHPS